MPTEKPLIYLITEGHLTTDNFARDSKRVLETVKLAVESEIAFIQIREKNLAPNLVLKLVSKSREITKQTKTKLLVNDRFDIALAGKAGGVHLRSSSLPTQEVRRVVNKDFIVGVSTHSLKDAERARDEGADFVTFSPIFETDSKKKFGAPQGLGKLREVCQKLGSFPVIALGGVDDSNIELLLKVGAAGIAAIRFLNETENLKSLRKSSDTIG